MKVAKTSKNLKETQYPPQKKLLKRKGNSIIQAKTNSPISHTSSEGLKLYNNSNEAWPTSRRNIKSIFTS